MVHLLTEHWELVTQLVVYVSLVVGLYWKLKERVDLLQKEAVEHWDRIESDVRNLRESLKEHETSDAPHINCPVHTQAISDITDRLDRIQGDIGGIRVDLAELNRTLLLIAAKATIAVEKRLP